MTPEEAPVHQFTRDWWERLPEAFRALDRQQNPEAGGLPLLRWMDGIGRVVGQHRDLNEAMHEGGLVDPEVTPDHLLPWLAFLLGFSERQRSHRPGVLRDRLRAHVAAGRNGVGTRQYIAEATRAFLRPGAQVQVLASAEFPWTLIIGVDDADVPDGDYARLEASIWEADVVPAGHVLRIQQIRATWDEWEAAAGETWEEKERNIRTWQESDTAGVELH